MKQFYHRIVAVLGKIGAALAACSGCHGPNSPPDRPDNLKIHWTGIDSGFQDDTEIPADNFIHPTPRQ